MTLQSHTKRGQCEPRDSQGDGRAGQGRAGQGIHTQSLGQLACAHVAVAGFVVCTSSLPSYAWQSGLEPATLVQRSLHPAAVTG